MRRALGWVAMAVGVLGMLLCFLVIAGIWRGHGTLQGQARELVATLDSALGRASELVASADERVSVVQARALVLQANVDKVTAKPEAGEQARDELLLAVDSGIDAEYTALRERYRAARDQAATALSVSQRISALLPGRREGSDSVAAAATTVDTQLNELDAALTGLRKGLESRELPIDEAAAQLTEGAGRVDELLGPLGETLASYEGRLAKARAELASLAAAVARAMSWITFGLTLAVLYAALLHGALFLLGRNWAREVVPAPTPRIELQPPPLS